MALSNKLGLRLVTSLTKRLQFNQRKEMSFCSWVKEEIYRDHFEPGIYVCVECDHKLFSSRAKYEHDTPWPAFTETITEESVKKIPEEGSEHALKVLCGKCGNGLGHEFLQDGPDNQSRF